MESNKLARRQVEDGLSPECYSTVADGHHVDLETGTYAIGFGPHPIFRGSSATVLMHAQHDLIIERLVIHRQIADSFDFMALFIDWGLNGGFGRNIVMNRDDDTEAVSYTSLSPKEILTCRAGHQIAVAAWNKTQLKMNFMATLYGKLI